MVLFRYISLLYGPYIEKTDRHFLFTLCQNLTFFRNTSQSQNCTHSSLLFIFYKYFFVTLTIFLNIRTCILYKHICWLNGFKHLLSTPCNVIYTSSARPTKSLYSCVFYVLSIITITYRLENKDQNL